MLLLGYLCEPEADHLLHRRYFPSKVGGKPAWLDPENLPDGDTELFCQKCQQPLTFLLQVYAGRDSPPEAFHRIIYVFVCLGCSNEFVAFRCQLPKENKFYGPAPALKSDTSQEDECLKQKCCPACGIPTKHKVEPKIAELGEDGNISTVPLMHSRCKKVSEWNGLIPFVFGERQIEIEEENLDPADIDPESYSYEYELIRRYQLEQGCGPDSDYRSDDSEIDDDEDEDSPRRPEEDPVFEKFSEYITLNPGHIIQYYPEALQNPSPLWATSYKIPTDQELLDLIKKCENCGGNRKLEFQIQPNLIFELGADRLSFETLAIYTCVKSCNPNKTSNSTVDISQSSSKVVDRCVAENVSVASSHFSSYIKECVVCKPEPFFLNDR